MAGLWVDSGAGFAVGDFECAEADELDGFCFFDTEFDSVDDGVYGALCVGFCGVEVFLDCCCEFDFVHGFLCWVEIGVSYVRETSK